jgi:hypothetical protein
MPAQPSVPTLSRRLAFTFASALTLTLTLASASLPQQTPLADVLACPSPGPHGRLGSRQPPAHQSS